MADTVNHRQLALDHAKKGGDIEKAKVHAILALVQAVEANTEALQDLGAESRPISVMTWAQSA
jgi:hypothetical protein